MTRFVVIASLRRGSIEPAEVLNDHNQAIAIARYEADEGGVGEIVTWRNGEPYAGRCAGGDRLPKISKELRTQLRGTPMQVDDESALERRRAGISARV